MASEVAIIVTALAWLGDCATLEGQNETNIENEHPTIFVENIRRQLMTENYDYMLSASEEMLPTRHELSNEGVAAARDYGIYRPVEQDSDINDDFILRANDIQPADDHANDNSHATSKKDVLYHVDDDRLKQEAAVSGLDSLSTDEPSATPSTTKAIYKLLKVKESHPNRRSLTYRRFIQEEKDGGVVIFNLNNEPIPEFRLPIGRRQYMMDQGDVDSALEIAPFSDVDDETEQQQKLERTP